MAEELDNADFMAAMEELSNHPTQFPSDSDETKDTTDSINTEAETKVDDVDQEHEASTTEDVTEETPPVIDDGVGVEVHRDDGSEETRKASGEIDKNDYEKYKEFYDTLTKSSVNIDGVDLEGISDADALLDMQERNFKNSRKLDEFNDIKPLMKTIRDNGLNDPAKLALAIEALNGNEDAIKQIVKNANIDPFQLDYDNIDESTIDAGKYTQSAVEVSFDEFVDNANSLGVQDKVVDLVISKWDNESLALLSSDKTSGDNIIKHIKSGAFEDVRKEMLNLERRDETGNYRRLNSFDQYAEASMVVANRFKANTTPIANMEETPNAPAKPSSPAPSEQTAKEEQEIEKRVANATKASDSTSGPDSESAKVVDFNDLSNEDFMKQMNSFMS